MDLAGQTLGQYQIIEEVGSGGMATVYKAYQPGLDRYVAIKVLPPLTAQVEGFEERFFREARAIAQLNHPNILPIYDVGIDDSGISYFAMKYVPDKTLSDLMLAEPMPVKQAAHFIIQAAEALHHAHNRGILHRDVKPGNMLLDENDWLLLADFGLAKIAESHENLTATGMSMGTPSYASPEQVEGMPVDARTDVYSLGIVMFEMLTGTLPYNGETPISIMFKHVHEPLPMPRTVNPDIPEGVEQIILKATAKDREERYATAHELAEDMRQYLAIGSVTVAPAPAPTVETPAIDSAQDEPGQPKTNKKWLVVGGIAAVILVLLALAGFFWWQNSGSIEQEAQANEALFNNTVSSDDRLRALGRLFELDGEYNDRARALYNKLLTDQKIDLFTNIKSEEQAPLRTVVQGTYSYLNNTEADNQILGTMQTALQESDKSEDKTLAGEIDNWLKGREAAAAGDYVDAEVAYGVAIGLNNQNPATFFERGVVKTNLEDYADALADFETAINLNEDWQEPVSRAVQNNPPLHIAAWEQQDIYQTVAALIPQPDDTPTPTPSPTATHTPAADTATPTSTPLPTDTPTSTPTPQPTDTPAPTDTPTPAPVAGPSFGGGTFQLVFTKWDGGQHNLYTVDTNGDNEQFLLSRAAGPSWSPDKNFIYFYGEPGVDRQVVAGVENIFGGISNGIIRIEANPLPASVDEIKMFQGNRWNDGTARWTKASPDGTVVAFDARPGGGYRLFFINGIDGGLYPYEIDGEQADWSPDGEKVIYRSGRAGRTGLWTSNWTDSDHANLTNNGSDSFPAWSPDGKTIAFSRDEGGNVDIYTVNLDGTNLQRLTDAPGPDTLPVYTPRGDIIFRSARGGDWGIWKMNANGQLQTEIVPDARVGPDWANSKMDIR